MAPAANVRVDIFIIPFAASLFQNALRIKRASLAASDPVGLVGGRSPQASLHQTKHLATSVSTVHAAVSQTSYQVRLISVFHREFTKTVRIGDFPVCEFHFISLPTPRSEGDHTHWPDMAENLSSGDCAPFEAGPSGGELRPFNAP